MLELLLLACILVGSTSSVNGATDPAQATALKGMFTGLNSPTQLTGWRTDDGADPCGQSWLGVTCSGSSVTEIKLPDMQLSGNIGYQLDKLTALTNFDVSNNNLQGLPFQLPPNVQRLNLARNSFSGTTQYSISQMSSLKYLDLSFNAFSGNLPAGFSSLSGLNSMYLQNNQFTGPIDALAGLPLDNLKDGNSWTSGPAPPPPPFTPPPANRRTNPGQRSGGNGSPSGNGGGGKKSGVNGGAVAGIVISILVVSAIVAFFLVKRKSKRSLGKENLTDDRPFTPLASNDLKEMKSIQSSSSIEIKTVEAPASINLKPPPIDRHKSFDEDDLLNKPVVKRTTSTAPIEATVYSIADLQMATGSFSVDNLVGEGSIGRVYKAQFDDGRVLAVKKINSSAVPSQSPDEFLEVVSNVSRLHHPNVTELIGYCCEYGQYLLVYEFHRNGSLHDYLHLSDEYSKPLTWSTRVKIALGTARALEYLHEVCSPSIVHKNFKSANILLDQELNPHLSECGLDSFVPDAEHEASNQSTGSGAPEVAMSGQYTLKSDVYSFGVVMLELLTGRKPFDSLRPRSEQSLVRWATPQLHDIDALSKMVDPALKGLYPAKSLSRFADVVALCVQPEPEFRPPMSEVVQALLRLVQRANMSKRTTGGTPRADDAEGHENLF
ncbi:hypothetical protein ACLOJK_000910 [Asimina triloba]